MNKDTFEEIQKIDSIWPISILALTSVFNWFLYFYFGYTKMDFFYSSIIGISLICVFLSLVRLNTKIDNQGIQFRFYPLHIKWQTISWDKVESAEIRSFSPLKEYGGWGLRYNKFGKAYTIKGNQGLQLHLKDGKNILIGSNRAEELEIILKTFKKIKV